MAGVMPYEQFQYVPPMTDNNPYVYQKPPVFLNPPNDKLVPYYPPATQFLNPPNDQVVPMTQQKKTVKIPQAIKQVVAPQSKPVKTDKAGQIPQGKDTMGRARPLTDEQYKQLLSNLFMFRIQ